MSEDPKALITEANTVLADCETYLEAAAREVLDIPDRREKVLERIAAARELEREQAEELERVLQDDHVSRVKEREAEIAYSRASSRASRVSQELGSDQLDPENRKAVARQMAGLIREDLEQRLDDIGARSDDPELQRTVANGKDEVVRVTHHFIRSRFPPARELQLAERNKSRAEARAILNRFYSLGSGE